MKSLILALGFAAGAVSACGGALPAPSKPSVPAQTVTVATPSKSLSQLPLYVAIQRGFFKELGLNVQFKEMTPPAQVAAVAAGEVDYTTAIGSSIQAAARGLPIKTVLTLAGKPQHVLVATKDISSVQQLAGKTVGISARGSTTERELQVVLQQNGLTEQSVQIVALGDSANTVAAMKAGRIDATVLPVPDNFVAEREAGGHTLVNIAQVMDAPLSGLSTSNKRLQDNPDQVVALIKGALKGTAYIKANKTETAALIAKFTAIDATTAAQAYDLVRDTYADTGIVTDAAIRNTIIDQQAAAALNLSQVVDWSFAKRAQG
ncbi:MAG TPA: ABC transporter substrate-binding protein [Chloroflexota bacterium]|nr:ABC transporter substrate-binding protein [Chloroflexota bacterium]